MTITSVERARRPRRIAADEAHSWARNLRLGNPYAKLVLSMLTIYVNGEGSCFVGAAALADDCELALETVRRRLAWLEGIGALARFPQWLDEHGRRNGDGRGRRTTDDIRLMIHADPGDIEARAHGDASEPQSEDAADDGENSPLPEGGTNPVSPPFSPLAAPSLRSRAESSEPEPEILTPNPLSGGGRVVDQELEEDIQEFAKGYPAPITDMPRLRAVLAAMTRPERRRVIGAVKGYAAHIAECERKGKPRAVKDAHRWVSGGRFEGYVVAGERLEIASRQTHVPIESPAGKAWSTLHKIAHATPFQSAGGFLLPTAPSERLLAFASTPPEAEWKFIAAEQSNKVGAWDEMIREYLQARARPPLLWERNPGGKRGFMAPWDWPPLKDGSLCTGPP